MAASPSPGEETHSAPENVGEPVTMQQLSSLLENHRTGMKDDMTALIQTSSQSLHVSMDALRGDMIAFNKRLIEMETIVGENFERLTSAEATIKSMQSQNKLLYDHVEDLENRPRRSNLRIVNVPEGSETGREPKQFLADLLMETGPELFTSTPLIDRTHRTGPVSERGSTKSRSFVVCFHNYSDKDKLLRWAMKHELKFRNVTLRVYQDMSASLAKKRAAFNDIKQELYRKGVRFGLLHPARLRVTFEGETVYFDTPEEAKAFYDRRIAG
ncbi:hypothetical protein VZT92_005817 [Zoarces viviparus]|uniref:LINE-1 type transposase domain-containing protein 1 n=1 Tax=Zoarces viviparus TaxID=48416 RepID=A0AAW1FNA3_ZOAVI